MIRLYDFDPTDIGFRRRLRSLHGAHYFARFPQRLISAFTIRTNYGVLYDIDMRCARRGGPGRWPRISIRSRNIRNARPWTWEHHGADAGARDLGIAGFRKRIEQGHSRRGLVRPREPIGIAGDVADMRRAICEGKGAENDILAHEIRGMRA